ncbi:MAG TPA: ROK family protein [Candidatus Saccharibacteria bacterium]|nr:ROK family protein [Candidatus Saccharibacteria bacterium]
MFISVDVGGTNTRLASSNGLETLAFDETIVRRVNTHDYVNDIGFIVDEALRLSQGEPIQAVGIGIPGTLNDEGTELLHAENLQSWMSRPIAADISGKLHCPVFMDNDAVAMGLGEVFFGETSGDFDYIIWGTGIGGSTIRHEHDGIKVEKRIWETSYKDWELENGGNALNSKFGKPTTEFTTEEWDTVAAMFETNLKKYCDTYTPKAVVFGGGLAIKHTDLLNKIGSELGLHLTVTKFGEDSGLFGGFGLIRRGLAA